MRRSGLTTQKTAERGRIPWRMGCMKAWWSLTLIPVHSSLTLVINFHFLSWCVPAMGCTKWTQLPFFSRLHAIAWSHISSTHTSKTTLAVMMAVTHISFCFWSSLAQTCIFCFPSLPLEDFLLSQSLPHPLASALAVLLLKFLRGLLSVGVGKEVTYS